MTHGQRGGERQEARGEAHTRHPALPQDYTETCLHKGRQQQPPLKGKWGRVLKEKPPQGLAAALGQRNTTQAGTDLI